MIQVNNLITTTELVTGTETPVEIRCTCGGRVVCRYTCSENGGNLICQCSDDRGTCASECTGVGERLATPI